MSFQMIVHTGKETENCEKSGEQWLDSPAARFVGSGLYNPEQGEKMGEQWLGSPGYGLVALCYRVVALCCVMAW